MHAISLEFNCLSGIYGKASIKLMEYIESRRVIIVFLGACTSIVHLPGRVPKFQREGNCLSDPLLFFRMVRKRGQTRNLSILLSPQTLRANKIQTSLANVGRRKQNLTSFFVNAKLSLFSHYVDNPN